MRRRTVRPFGSSVTASRGMSLLVGLAVLWVVYDSIRQPAAWHWLAASEDNVAQAPVVPAAGQVPQSLDENVSPGPNDLDPEAFQHFQQIAELITDKTKLQSREMIAYWQLLGWSRTQPFAEFEQRARRDLAVTQLWEEPQKYRGTPIRLRMHVRRVLKHEKVTENPLGAKDVYEAWGWTDESKSLPYVVVFTEKPTDLPVGNEVQAEVVFVGYFLKIMTYDTFEDKRRGTPLMVGRVRVVAPTKQAREAASNWEIAGLVLGGLLLIPVGLWFVSQSRRQKYKAVVPPAALDPHWVPFQGDAQEPLTEFDPTGSRDTR
jgi:hypothetical protein